MGKTERMDKEGQVSLNREPDGTFSIKNLSGEDLSCLLRMFNSSCLPEKRNFYGLAEDIKKAV